MRAVQKQDIRPSTVANMFYPGEPQILEAEIGNLIRSSQSIEVEGEIKALISPHAGYIYSGLVAAAGYKLLRRQQYSVVAIISPSHHEYFPGVSVFNGRGYITPFGMVQVASDLADGLIAMSARIFSSWAGHGKEHALEVQLPFLQKVLEDFRIIPIVMGAQDSETCHVLGEALAAILAGVPSLIVASSDLSHYHAYDEAIKIDRDTCDLIAAYDDVGLMNALQKGTCEACGGGPMVAAMVASKDIGANKSQVLIYRNSGDVTGDHSRVVGYLSAAFVNVN